MARKAFIMASNGPESIGRLQYAETDADAFAKVINSFRYGFEIIRPEKGSSQFAVLEAFSTTALNCKREDDFLCYFSGHGDLSQGKLYLVLSDKAEPIEFISLDVSLFQDYIKRCKAKNKLLILDCCHSGGAVGMKSGSGNLIENVAPVSDSDNHFVLVASERLAKIREYDDLKGSFLTQKICEALTKEFNNVDTDRDQHISIHDVLSYLEDSRAKYNQNKEPDKKVPLPYIFGQRKGDDFYLTQESYRWKPQDYVCHDGSKIVLLPVEPDEGLVLCIGKYSVTNSQYKKFIADINMSEPEGRYLPEDRILNSNNFEQGFHPWKHDQFNAEDQPVVCISYYNASSYCKWLTSKLKDTFGQQTKAFVPPAVLWNFAAYGEQIELETRKHVDRALKGNDKLHDKKNSPVTVNELKENSLGVAGLLGNIWEWTAGVNKNNYSVKTKFLGHPILKGGGFLDDVYSPDFRPHLESHELIDHKYFKSEAEEAKYIEVASRNFKSFDLGFRIGIVIPVNYLSRETRELLTLCPPLSYKYTFWKSVKDMINEEDTAS